MVQKVTGRRRALRHMRPQYLLALLAGAVWAFFWAVDHDQFDDLETPGLLPLDDSSSEEPGA